MSALTEFLLARIAEVESAARAAGDLRMWRSDARPDDAWLEREDDGARVSVAIRTRVEEQWAEHVLHHLPGRVLAECEAKRRIVAMYEARSEQDHLTVQAHATGLLLAVRALALPYADHPDYRQEWKP